VALRLHGSQKIKGLTLIYDHGFQIFEKNNETKAYETASSFTKPNFWFFGFRVLKFEKI
jgi:hypothetical protein